jgi:hypothetical protein
MTEKGGSEFLRDREASFKKKLSPILGSFVKSCLGRHGGRPYVIVSLSEGVGQRTVAASDLSIATSFCYSEKKRG